MKAIVYEEYGGTEKLRLRDLPKPAPEKGEVLVKIYAASVNSWDCDLLRGHPFLVRLLGGLRKPRNPILGADIAGVVESVGPGVTDFAIGDEVFGDIAGAGFGGFAEYVTAPAKLLAHKSPRMSFSQAAALPQAALLALQGLRYGGPLRRGMEILINGAGGGVGTLALQYALSEGARVTCVDKPEKFELLRKLGAAECIDYTAENYTEAKGRYDHILDVIAHRSVSEYKRALKKGGTFAMIGGSMGWLLFQMMVLGPVFSLFAGKKLGIMGYRTGRAALEEINVLFDRGVLLPVIDREYPLEEVPHALQLLLDGQAKGKLVIRISES